MGQWTPMDSPTCPMVQWTGQTVGQAWSEGGMSSGHPMDIHWTGRTIPSGQRILMANLDMSGGRKKNVSEQVEHLGISNVAMFA